MANFSIYKLRPETGAGGYARDDGDIEFYQRINSLIGLNSTILDFGAGRSAATDGNDPRELAAQSYAFRQRLLKGRVKKIVGIDIDPQVLSNPTLDEAHQLMPGCSYPFADSSFDLIFADWVVEHIEDVPFFAAEIKRILKPEGWFCARTPNRWSYISIASRIIGAKHERSILNALQPWRKDQDAFPKYYRLNTQNAIRNAFDPSNWRNCSYFTNPTPAYHGNRYWLFKSFDLYQKLVPNCMATTMMIFMQKLQSVSTERNRGTKEANRINPSK